MSRRAVSLVAAASVLAPVSTGAGAARPPAALSVSPARVTLLGSASRTIQVRNRGSEPAVVDVASAGFALSLRGRPQIVAPGRGARDATAWLTLRPQRLTLSPGASGSLVVSSSAPPRADPGDHDALVLLSTRAPSGGRVAVLMRMGVVVDVRVAGATVRHLELRGLRVRRAGGSRLLELELANRGNVAEMLQRGRVVVTLRRRGSTLARLVAAPRVSCWPARAASPRSATAAARVVPSSRASSSTPRAPAAASGAARSGSGSELLRVEGRSPVPALPRNRVSSC